MALGRNAGMFKKARTVKHRPSLAAAQLGRAHAWHLGSRVDAWAVVLGDSVQQAVCGIYTEINGKLQAGALRLGTGQVEFLNAEDARNTTETNKSPRPRWDLVEAPGITATPS
jgi:hypothetical protein